MSDIPLASDFTAWQAAGFDAATCPVRNVLDRIGDKWTMLTLAALAATPRRFSELRLDIPPVSAKVLSQRLKEMEGRGVVTRTIRPTKPPSVEYALTPLGQELVPALDAIVAVGHRLKTAGQGAPPIL